MSHKTKTQLSTAVGQRLKLTDALNSLPAEDAAYIEDQYDTLLAQWSDRDIVYWSNTNRTTEEIPAAVFQPLVDMLTGHCAMAFGKDEPVVPDEGGGPVSISTRGWRNLKRHARRPQGGFPTRARYY